MTPSRPFAGSSRATSSVTRPNEEAGWCSHPLSFSPPLTSYQDPMFGGTYPGGQGAKPTNAEDDHEAPPSAFRSASARPAQLLLRLEQRLEDAAKVDHRAPQCLRAVVVAARPRLERLAPIAITGDDVGMVDGDGVCQLRRIRV